MDLSSIPELSINNQSPTLKSWSFLCLLLRVIADFDNHSISAISIRLFSLQGYIPSDSGTPKKSRSPEAVKIHALNINRLSIDFSIGIKDPVVGRAIAKIHSRPGDNWSVKRLAQTVAMSPSRFAARFSAALGDSPIAYVTKWRMNVAGRLLDDSQQSISEIAADMRYENVAAFTRSFKRHLGVTPAAWRLRHSGLAEHHNDLASLSSG